MQTAVQQALPTAKRAVLLGHEFFPNLISYPMSIGLHSVFYLSAVMCLVAAFASILRGNARIATRETQVEDHGGIIFPILLVALVGYATRYLALYSV